MLAEVSSSEIIKLLKECWCRGGGQAERGRRSRAADIHGTDLIPGLMYLQVTELANTLSFLRRKSILIFSE